MITANGKSLERCRRCNTPTEFDVDDHVKLCGFCLDRVREDPNQRYFLEGDDAARRDSTSHARHEAG